MTDRLLLTCEHGGNRVPPRYRHLFRNREGVLRSHRGWDPGALDLARRLARRLDAPLVPYTLTRLLIDANRSAGNPRVLGTAVRDLPPAERDRLRSDYHDRHHAEVRSRVERHPAGSGRVVHVGVHSFTPVLRGRRRAVQVGLLYDPARGAEAGFAARWRDGLRAALPALRVRRNQPYRGRDDGLTRVLRRAFPETRYLGLELEINQALLRDGRLPRPLVDALTRTLHAALR